jgi:hypothetical protein
MKGEKVRLLFKGKKKKEKNKKQKNQKKKKQQKTPPKIKTKTFIRVPEDKYSDSFPASHVG